MVDLGGFAPPSRTLFSLLHTAITFIIYLSLLFVNQLSQSLALTHIGLGSSFGHGFQALGSWGCCFTCCHNVTSLKKYLANFFIVWLYNPANGKQILLNFICDHAFAHVAFGSVGITIAQSISYA